VLEFDRVTRSFGYFRVLDKLSFTIPLGTLSGFCGPNGAGKTTAMRALVGIIGIDSGLIRWRGDPVDRDLIRRFGYLPEERGLYPAMDVRSHLVFLARLRGISKVRARHTTERVMDEFSISAFATRRIDSLSLGNAQRVQLASALVHDPALIVLDEPFNGLDPLASDHLAAVLRRRVDDGATVLFSSHHLDTVERLCDRVVVMSEGRCVLSGSVRDLIAPRNRDRRSLNDVFRDAVRSPYRETEDREACSD
jgi:ABC-2 type transport system ATP-binding protein